MNEYLPPEGIAGIMLIAGGIYTLHIKSLDRQGILAPLLSLRNRTSRLSVLTGFTIACYSVVNKVGISHFSPFLYVYFIFTVTAVLLIKDEMDMEIIDPRQSCQINPGEVIIYRCKNSSSPRRGRPE